jgi:hypothetical protein
VNRTVATIVVAIPRKSDLVKALTIWVESRAVLYQVRLGPSKGGTVLLDALNEKSTIVDIGA